MPHRHRPADDEWNDGDWEDADEDRNFEDRDRDDWGDDNDDDEADDAVPCPFCGKPVYEDAPRCPHCERYITDADAPSRMKPVWIVVGTLACLYAITRWIFG